MSRSLFYNSTPSTTTVTMQTSDFDEISEVETWSDSEHCWVKVPIRKPCEDPTGEIPDELSETEFPDLDTEIEWHAKKPSLDLSDAEIIVPETPMSTLQRRRKINLRGTPIQKRQARRRQERLLHFRAIESTLGKLERKVEELKKLNSRLVFENTDLRRDLTQQRVANKVLAQQYTDMKVNYAETLSKYETFKRRTTMLGARTCAVKTHPDVWKHGQPGRFAKQNK